MTAPQSHLAQLPVIVLTGGIGSGKSTAAAYWASLGVRITDADDLSHALCQAPDGAALPLLHQAFGPSIFQSDGSLDRPALRTLVFEDPSALGVLEGILHPLVAEQAQSAFHRPPSLAEASVGYQVYVVPLWIEAAARHERPAWARRVVVVDLPKEVQRQRTLERSGGRLSPQTLDAILARQASRAQRLAAADHVLWNGESSPQPLQDEIARLHRQLQTEILPETRNHQGRGHP